MSSLRWLPTGGMARSSGGCLFQIRMAGGGVKPGRVDWGGMGGKGCNPEQTGTASGFTLLLSFNLIPDRVGSGNAEVPVATETSQVLIHKVHHL